MTIMAQDLDQLALQYHEASPAGKLAVNPTKPMETQHDLSLAYSPGVAAACLEIEKNPQDAARYTGRGNLVAVITNGTAVLGLGNIGPLASKPVMEGKGALFKRFADVNVYDIEVATEDVETFIEVVAHLEPSFGGINLEDIKAPECFEIEKALRERMNIPVFHDDQHGTAIIVATAIVNGLQLIGKDIDKVKVVVTGAGAAAIACLDLLVSMGLDKDNVLMIDREGVVHDGRRNEVGPYKASYAVQTEARTLDDAMQGADVLLGLSGPGIVQPEMVAKMAAKPLVLALANPIPEIMPEDVKAVRDDAIIATGRSDYPNQVNNVLCFPFIFRGALDVGATTINEEMKIACVKALARVAQSEPSDVVSEAYAGEPLQFGPDYIIPKPFDPRLIFEIAPDVAEAAMTSGVATRPIEDLDAYRAKLSEFVYRAGAVMRPIFDTAGGSRARVVFAEGEERRVLQAVQQVVDLGLAKPILVGRPDVIETRLQELALRLDIGRDVEVVNPLWDERYRQYWETYHELMGRIGVSPEAAKYEIRTNQTAIAAVMCHRGEADAMLCGTDGRFRNHLQVVSDVIGPDTDSHELSTLMVHILPSGPLFICDTHVTHEPSTHAMVEMTLLAAAEVGRFGLEPRVALVSRSNFGTHHSADSIKMRAAVQHLHAHHPELQVDGEMQADAALSERIRALALPGSSLVGTANLLVMPNVEAANIASNVIKATTGAVTIGPILIGSRIPAHVLTQSASVRDMVNMCALAAAQSVVHAHG
jgi:malate dehydrogenase (oxaloacetate-decarboxylating)(NADP+)